MKKIKYIQFGVIVAALALVITANETIGAFGEGTAEFDSIKIGQQGIGGVTYFNGSIVNNTSSGGVLNPVTFGDDIRIDGRVWRGATACRASQRPAAGAVSLQLLWSALLEAWLQKAPRYLRDIRML